MLFVYTYSFFLQEALPPPAKYLNVYFHSFKLHFLPTLKAILYWVYIANNFTIKIKIDKKINPYLISKK
ncbi:MAG: hypothetical protein IPJ03_07460 [Ignavibacteriales bacterium]|nr:hypothetical protein [Ignavibacteriales bacterium]